ncbi:MAG: thermonuclease family protein [Chloroflexi bacterium]|nr:thermonuclease family protein [Chloroflexota bacterium]
MYEYPCKIVRVVDGDTVDVDIDLGFSHWIHNERIRLYGVDTPECRTRDAEEKAAGLLAKKFVEDALHVGGTYTLTTKERGKFGRYLGVIMLSDRTSINAVLVTEHLAVPYHGQSKQEIEDAHATNYEILKDKGLL